MTMIDKLKDSMFPWQPIEDAPRDATHVLIKWYSDAKNMEVIREAWWTTPWEGAPDLQCSWRVCHNNSTLLDSSIHGGGATHFMTLDTPEKLAKALRIAVKQLERMRMENSDQHGIAKNALKQIDEVLK